MLNGAASTHYNIFTSNNVTQQSPRPLTGDNINIRSVGLHTFKEQSTNISSSSSSVY